jgi:hypothetical protein
MKNFVLLLSLFALGFCTSVQAEILKGRAIDEVSTISPKECISITVVDNFSLNNNIVLKKGYILTGKMTDVTSPQEWHHNASFTFIPTSYTDLEGKKHEITSQIKGTYRQKLQPDYKHSEITVGNLMFSPAYIDDTKKIIHGETKEVWDDYANRSTPWGKGEQIDIKPNDTIYFNFPD